MIVCKGGAHSYSECGTLQEFSSLEKQFIIQNDSTVGIVSKLLAAKKRDDLVIWSIADQRHTSA